MLNSFLLGLVFSLSLFAFCLFLVVGAKTVINALKIRFIKPTEEPLPTPKKPQKPRKKTVRKKTVVPFRSIEINPEEIDRIYVKKSS